MARQVIKRDGTKEPFDGEKMRKSIEVAGLSAGLSMDRVNEVVNQVLGVALELANSKEEIATTELSECVFGELVKLEPKIAGPWKEYEEEKRRRAQAIF